MRRLLQFPIVVALAFLLGASGGWCAIGDGLESAKKTDFFTFFHLQEVSRDDKGLVAFKPSGAAFRELVTVYVTTDGSDRIGKAQLDVSRSFVDDKKNGVFARDITKSFIRAMILPDDAEKVKDLVNEIAQPGEGTLILADGNPPKVPAEPTPGYQAYLGKKASYEQDFEKATLKLANDQSLKTLSVTIEPRAK